MRQETCTHLGRLIVFKEAPHPTNRFEQRNWRGQARQFGMLSSLQHVQHEFTTVNRQGLGPGLPA